MTSDDELLKRLELLGAYIRVANYDGYDVIDQAAASIRELEAELAFYRGFHDGVCKAGTHVVVPVEPTEAMLESGGCYFGGAWSEATKQMAYEVYRAMIKAAQECDNG